MSPTSTRPTGGPPHMNAHDLRRWLGRKRRRDLPGHPGYRVEATRQNAGVIITDHMAGLNARAAEVYPFRIHLYLPVWWRLNKGYLDLVRDLLDAHQTQISAELRYGDLVLSARGQEVVLTAETRVTVYYNLAHQPEDCLWYLGLGHDHTVPYGPPIMG